MCHHLDQRIELSSQQRPYWIKNQWEYQPTNFKIKCIRVRKLNSLLNYCFVCRELKKVNLLCCEVIENLAIFHWTLYHIRYLLSKIPSPTEHLFLYTVSVKVFIVRMKKCFSPLNMWTSKYLKCSKTNLI